jgi:hypothetical protein
MYMVTGYKSYTPFYHFLFLCNPAPLPAPERAGGITARQRQPARPFISWESLVRGSKIRQGLSPAREANLIWTEKEPKHSEIAHGARHVLASRKLDCEKNLVSH